MQEPAPNFLCCELSEELNEPMAGTAVFTSVWFLLEYTRPWGAKATVDNELPAEVRRWLGDEVLKDNGRLQFIRQFRPDADVLTLFVGVNHETRPRLYEFHLGSYEDLFELNMAGIVAGDGRYHPHLVTGRRYFVCTNGKRDRSCALHGAALYRSLAEKGGNSVWMTTHLGGHRFAPTLLSLPDGTCYGRVKPENIAQLLRTTGRGELWPDKLRGRTCYNPIEQLADYHLRQKTGQTPLNSFRLIRTVELGDGRWQIHFNSPDRKQFIVLLAQTETMSVYANSGSTKIKEVPQYQLVDISTDG